MRFDFKNYSGSPLRPCVGLYLKLSEVIVVQVSLLLQIFRQESGREGRTGEQHVEANLVPGRPPVLSTEQKQHVRRT